MCANALGGVVGPDPTLSAVLHLTAHVHLENCEPLAQTFQAGALLRCVLAKVAHMSFEVPEPLVNAHEAREKVPHMHFQPAKRFQQSSKSAQCSSIRKSISWKRVSACAPMQRVSEERPLFRSSNRNANLSNWS